ncbi:5-formyltetrahydrofolate cyclo-ligase [Methyloligella sp. GL2]|uniref:5-formyltetrahydrofolate cyclo-ligase n=2 Tax=unclassified Methyloligella TaxID=2625955 RepID=UPI00157BB681|nr:5-formyltetrahydrofolate cyclo-ligase [Methyloligella sp. GL2]QKP78247.1 5-formyltetrahydrofolate cyclo-ligase [Methyloligella sp. GL2]
MLIAARLEIPAAVQADAAVTIAAGLDKAFAQLGITDLSGLTVSAYWPFRGEPDLRDWLASVCTRGGKAALPVIEGKAMPLSFRFWQPDAEMEEGRWNIPIPAASESATPDIVIAPLVGFDREGYRLGYGGGFYDRTLAALPQGTRFIGVGYAESELPTTHPQDHDIKTDLIVTEREIIAA